VTAVRIGWLRVVHHSDSTAFMVASHGETILFWHRGLSLSDIALGHAMLKKGEALGIKQRLKFG